jgi:hypothetical protein
MLVVDVRVGVAEGVVLVLVDVLRGGIEVGTVRVLVVPVEMVVPVDVPDRSMNVGMRVAIDGQSDRADETQRQRRPGDSTRTRMPVLSRTARR